MFGFSYYLLLPLARGTNGNGYSSSVLLPTPLASDTGDVGKGLDIQISANGSYRKMNKDGKAWTARLSHVVYRMTPTTLEKPYLNPDWVEWLMGFPHKWTDIPFGRRALRHPASDRRCTKPQQTDENAGQCGFAAAGVPDSQIHCGHRNGPLSDGR